MSWKDIVKAPPKLSVQEIIKAMVDAMYKALGQDEDMIREEGNIPFRFEFIDKEIEEKLEPIISDTVQKIVNWEEGKR
jgi:hypothetical protein